MKTITLRFIYLYLFSTIGLIVVVIGLVQGVNLAIKSTFFKDADKYQVYSSIYTKENQVLSTEELERQKVDFENNQKLEVERSRQRQLSDIIAMIVVGSPLYLYHWNLIKKENGR